MLKIKNLHGQCQHCGGPIEFHAESAGATADCPHCNQPTELFLETPPNEGSPLRTKVIAFTIIASIILIAGLVGSSMALKRAKRMRADRDLAPAQSAPEKPADPFAKEGFRVAPVSLDKGSGTSLVYAIGSIANTTTRQRFGVKVEIELLDGSGIKVGVASDYQKVIEANAEWKFRALVVEKKAVSAKVITVSESR